MLPGTGAAAADVAADAGAIAGIAPAAAGCGLVTAPNVCIGGGDT